MNRMSKAVEYIQHLAKEQQESQRVNTIGFLDFSLELATFSFEDVVYENDIKVLQEEGLVSYEAYLSNGGRVSADLQESPSLKEVAPLDCTEQEIEPIPREETIQYEL